MSAAQLRGEVATHFNVIPALAGRVSTRSGHALVTMTERLAVSCGLIDIIKQSLLEIASIIPCEFGKANGRGQSQEAGPTF